MLSIRTFESGSKTLLKSSLRIY